MTPRSGERIMPGEMSRHLEATVDGYRSMDPAEQYAALLIAYDELAAITADGGDDT
jgi:hypothetical protein